MSAEKQENGENISWHPAFFEAIQRELAQYEEVFQFISEFQLTTEPLRIDLVIIKKLKDIPITKNIATIFRTDNLVEYKSPTDYLSVADFYKVYGYACLYTFLKAEQSSTKPSIPAEHAEPQKLAHATKLTARTVSALKELSLTFVVSHHPRELLTHLQQVRGYTVDGSIPGIYIVQGDIFPIQLIDNRELSDDENIWLRSLDDRLDVARMTRLTQEIERLGKAARLSAYVDVIARANVETLREAIKMRRSSVTLDQVLVETGLAAKWEARGRLEGEARGRLEGEARGRLEGEAEGRLEGEARGRLEGKAEGRLEGKLEVARNFIKMGLSPEQVAEAAELELETLKVLCGDVKGGDKDEKEFGNA